MTINPFVMLWGGGTAVIIAGAIVSVTLRGRIAEAGAWSVVAGFALLAGTLVYAVLA